jgi:hypothetical protein
MFPLETVRTRLAVDHARYRGVTTAFRTIVAAEGVPALYRVCTAPDWAPPTARSCCTSRSAKADCHVPIESLEGVPALYRGMAAPD